MKWARMSVKEVLKELKTSENGLNSDEAARRLETYGKNELVEEKKAGPLRMFLAQFMDILIILLILAAVASYFVGDVLDSAVILFVVVVNATVGFIQEYRAEQAMEKLKGLVSTEATVIRDGMTQKIPASELTIGDILIIEEGDNVPADIRLIEAYDLRIDESTLTGESIPVQKTHENPEDERDVIAFMDSDVVSGRGKGAVIAVGMDTSIGRIAEMIQEDEGKTPLQEKISSLGKSLGLIAVVVCAMVFAIQFLRGLPLVDTFMTAVSLAVASVPEGLPAILTLTLALGMQRMARSNAIVRRLLAVETLGSCSVICTDKTGTLTHNRMTVRESELTSPEMALLVSALCNNATISDGKVIGDPTDAAILSFADENGHSRKELEEKYPRLMEIPLDSKRKRMTTINQLGDGRYLLIKGAPEIILSRCSYVDYNGSLRAMDDDELGKWMSRLNDMTSRALRVLALAYRKLPDGDEEERDLVFAGLVGMMDPPRKEAADAIETCRKAGIKVVMITGDHRDTAVAIARELGLMDDGLALTGRELDELSDDEFEDMVEDVRVYARVFPEQKVRIVEALQRRDHVVAMTGDGVNDSPALKKAAIGVAMGSGTDVARESSDMVLQDDNFATIVKAVREGRTIFDNIRRFVKFQLSTNVGAILTIVSASLINLPVPFNPIQILWINIIMDGPPAQSLGVEPPESDIMLRKPEREDIMPRRNLLRIVIAGAVMAAGTLGLYIYMLSSGNSVERAMTVAFTVFVMFQIFNVFNCKSRTGFSNRTLLVAVAASLLLQILVVYLAPLEGVFRTVPLTVTDWVLIVAVASLILIAEALMRFADGRE
ncbi:MULTISPECIES: calcium-transporting P-type ATPase, PMR1-type [Methanothermobacter]|uniref:P-type Ca(2+) transporter n=1 Tax=Methanothermobacter marburgensis (strain ATCC BAA-927 / DSM 2133 / JCM 14651 / NBRC 100331 / OCM 82 / Marburg) TaxID=79929 RepID=D9PXM2_METTM|nr:calcium-transporting P-type ATPase, PMR1-type [Methanothermobacter sp. KEPCO-1]ADL58970.1 predicted cation transport ATPase [Methanothermobacter marburgensis str. Marburg]QEF94848.1 calcium-transporting P-type ATPase, PMR1-type [Methanothermobacter sp. KEPCO-1]QHN07982.1 calcium-transporting P-type ATPase, PMR1-type [Methanothermobacter sp. THM-2]WBF09507.1 calcium-transporting P-type ATPase, PMR1-type [Methanothermobacter marburgensis]